jgi:hypothetical protein
VGALSWAPFPSSSPRVAECPIISDEKLCFFLKKKKEKKKKNALSPGSIYTKNNFMTPSSCSLPE